MDTFLGILFVFAAFATVAVLVLGIVSFAVHGPFYKKHSNRLMRLRVLFQGLAVASLALAVWIYNA